MPCKEVLQWNSERDVNPAKGLTEHSAVTIEGTVRDPMLFEDDLKCNS